MKENMSRVDRIVRLVVGLAIVLVGLIVGSWWGLIGLIPLLTAAIGWCPLYSVFGFSTLPPARREEVAPGT